MATFDIIHVDETDSTNRWLREYAARTAKTDRAAAGAKPVGTVVWTDYQTAGRGCGSNTWESERGRNLLFSILIHPTWVKASRQFMLSMAISNAIRRALQAYVWQQVEVKWPNDIYVVGKKICGILIENSLAGGSIKDCIMGIGLNVNQTEFLSDAPNPVSLCQLRAGDGELRRMHVLDSVLNELERIISHWDEAAIAEEYRAHLYRREGFHRFSDWCGTFEAQLVTVEDDGHLVLRDRQGETRWYAFKEVSFETIY